MTENKEPDKGKKLGLSRPGKLELKKTVETGQVASERRTPPLQSEDSISCSHSPASEAYVIAVDSRATG